MTFIDGDEILHQQETVVRRPVQRIPGAAVECGNESRLRGGGGIDDIDVVTHAVAFGAEERQLPAVVRPYCRAIERASVGQQARLTRVFGIEIYLRVFVAADVL